MKIKEMVKVVKGRLLSGDPEADIDPSRISTDSRIIKKGEFFIALQGPNFNGNKFVNDAFGKKASGAIVSSREGVKNTGRILIEVRDTLKALQDIAHHHRMKFKIPVVAVTGSNGKTTVKDMIAHVLSAKYRVLKNEGTKNNQIGVPQTLLRLKGSHDICVLELGTNHRGEIRRLSRISRPSTAVITNIGPSHLEFLADLNGVYAAKKEIFDFMEKKRGIAVINGDDRFLGRLKDSRFRILRYGFKEGNDFRAEVLSIERQRLEFILNGRTKFRLNLFGVHNIYNALAAIAVASHFGVNYESIRKALITYKPIYMRLNLKKVDGIDIIDDSYNSNPLSMKCALEVMKDYPAKARWVVSADMLELGREGIRLHKMIGESIARSNVEGLLTFGKLSKHTLEGARKSGMKNDRLWHCSDHSQIAHILKKVLRKGDALLLKGSRGMRMETVIEELQKKAKV